MLEQDQEPRSGGMVKVLVFGAATVAVSAILYFAINAMYPPAPAPIATQPERARPETPKALPKAAEPAPEPEAPRTSRPRPKKEKPIETVAPPPAAPAGPTLIVESDVPGASVFVDRQYVGTTPLKSSGVAPGRHQLNASAEGEDGIAQTIEVGDAGETTVTLRFKEVRLDASVAVVHKHGMGACDGRPIASPSGLRYDTTNKKDAFAMSFKDLEAFEIDYLKKELKVKQRGGKTWNFTDRTDNADKLFIFHRDVTKAREKLAGQTR